MGVKILPEIKSLYYIAQIENLCSILDQGILSHNGVNARGVEYQAIYNPEIVENRKVKLTPSGHSLWDFANVYFQPRNPMFYRVVYNQGFKDNIIVLGLQPRIPELPGANISLMGMQRILQPISTLIGCLRSRGRSGRCGGKDLWFVQYSALYRNVDAPVRGGEGEEVEPLQQCGGETGAAGGATNPEKMNNLSHVSA
jgi:hypothetical protein